MIVTIMISIIADHCISTYITVFDFKSTSEFRESIVKDMVYQSTGRSGIGNKEDASFSGHTVAGQHRRRIVCWTWTCLQRV